MIRKMEAKDKSLYLEMADIFYHSDAVLHSVDPKHFSDGFSLMTEDSPFLSGFILEADGQSAGYAIVTFSYSVEAGGFVLWLEEVFILPDYRGRGLLSELLDFFNQNYQGQIKTMRLEVSQDNQGAIALYKQKGFRFLNYLQMYKAL